MTCSRLSNKVLLFTLLNLFSYDYMAHFIIKNVFCVNCSVTCRQIYVIFKMTCVSVKYKLTVYRTIVCYSHCLLLCHSGSYFIGHGQCV